MLHDVVDSLLVEVGGLMCQGLADGPMITMMEVGMEMVAVTVLVPGLLQVYQGGLVGLVND